MLKRQGGGLDGGSTFKSAKRTTKEQYLISVKKQL
jgi:hypothetical protein